MYYGGEFTLSRPLAPEHLAYLEAFARTRRMKRSTSSELPDPTREAAGLPLGEEGGYFVGGQGFMGQDHDSSILDHNQPPVRQPGLWCQWTPNEDGSAIEWDGNEKFYHPVEWIAYLIEHFIVRWGYILNGEVEWDDEGEFGLIRVVNNVVSEKQGRITYD